MMSQGTATSVLEKDPIRGYARLGLMIVLLVALCAGLVSSASAAPAGSPTTCNGTLSGGPYFGITVPEGATCNLFTAAVVGDVTAAPGSDLRIFIHSTIKGNVTTDGAMVQITGAVVVGNIAITGAPDSPTGQAEVVVNESTIVGGDITVRESAGTVLVDDNHVINGDIFVTSNFVPPFLEYPSQLSVRLNQVSGNVTVSSNTGPGYKDVHSNTITGALTCLDNEQPFIGGPNTAGSIVGDCF
jgi:hypothetical protein